MDEDRVRELVRDETMGNEFTRALTGVAREIARHEVASLCGLILRRLQVDALPEDVTVSGPVDLAHLRSIFGEALADFSGYTGSGKEPGE